MDLEDLMEVGSIPILSSKVSLEAVAMEEMVNTLGDSDLSFRFRWLWWIPRVLIRRS